MPVPPCIVQWKTQQGPSDVGLNVLGEGHTTHLCGEQVSAAEWMIITSSTFLRARRTCQVTSPPCALLPRFDEHKNTRGWSILKSIIDTDPYQNCARGPNHKAGDESLQTCPPAQSRGFIHGLHGHTREYQLESHSFKHCCVRCGV